MSELVLTKLSETATTVTLGWQPPAGAQGYVFITVDGKKSSTLDGSRSSVRVAKSNLPVTVRAFRTDSEGVYPLPVTPPPTDSPFFTWNRVADIPDQHDMTGGRIQDDPKGMKVTVTGAPDSSGGGDGSYGTTGNMNEPWATEGKDSWHSMGLLIPSATWKHSVASSGWNTFMEFHEPAIAQRSMHFGVWGSEPPHLQLASAGGDTTKPTDVWVRDTQALILDAWQEWLVHVHWSNGPRGYVEWWVNDRQIVSRTSRNLVSSWPGAPAVADNYPTAWNQAGVYRAPYFQAGHYRGPSRPDVDVTYMRAVKSGPTRESVQ